MVIPAIVVDGLLVYVDRELRSESVGRCVRSVPVLAFFRRMKHTTPRRFRLRCATDGRKDISLHRAL